ncbi:MAG: MBL fold metallo-hydrolase [Oscillospiraceae bacterium]|jgi:phosphoribosyl 1,2-cyclic phosphodiesterase|nr:MBL fold metallo-hydrolase [Oscillospiraceae bacterium]
MTQLTPLFSSSSGNSTYIGGKSGGILIDAGVSARRLSLALRDLGIDSRRIGAVFLTHEHSDHISGLRVFCERTGVPVFATEGTLRALEPAGHVTSKMQIHTMPPGGVEVNGLFVRHFRTSHDGAEPCGYSCEAEDGERFAVATDTGILTDETRRALLGCGTVLLESNHEVTMLQNGPYPYWLKRRILSDTGHLSNAACAELLSPLLQSGTCRFFLGHLSRENNTPALAEATALAAFAAVGARAGIDYELAVCRP